MNETLNLLVAAAMGMNLVALGTSRLPSLIRVAALQGAVLGVMPWILEPEPQLLALLVGAATIATKGLVIPALLRRAMRAAHIDRDLAPLLSYVPSLLLGAAGTMGAVVLARRLPLLPEHHASLLVAGALASVLAGLLLLIGRSKAISQVCGYLILENGIYLFGLLLIRATPLLVEGGILLDLTVGVFVTGIILDRIQRAFDTLDTRRLDALRD